MYFQNIIVGQYKVDISIQKVETGKKKGVMGPKQVKNLARQIPLDLKAWE